MPRPKADDPVPGQQAAFFEDPPPAPYEPPYLGSITRRQERSRRAGTELDHKWTRPVEGTGRKGTLQHGLLDTRQRVFQTGGELSNFVFWKRKLVSLPYSVWLQVSEKADWIEIVDHERNECWRIATAKIKAHGVTYEAGIGKRLGVPMEHWDIITASGRYRQEGTA